MKELNSTLSGSFVNYKKIKFCEYVPNGVFHNTSFSSQLNIEPNKLNCYNILGRKGLPMTNPLAYLVHL
jgi:hypothetical protein